MDESVYVNEGDGKGEPAPRRILISGSRSLDAARAIWAGASASYVALCRRAEAAFIERLEHWLATLSVTDAGLAPVTVVHGNARHGADHWADLWYHKAWVESPALRQRFHLERWDAEWDRYGRKAGMLRNEAMVATMERNEPHVVLACWDGASSGTKNLIDRATLAGLNLEVLRWD